MREFGSLAGGFCPGEPAPELAAGASGSTAVGKGAFIAEVAASTGAGVLDGGTAAGAGEKSEGAFVVA